MHIEIEIKKINTVLWYIMPPPVDSTLRAHALRPFEIVFMFTTRLHGQILPSDLN